MNDHQYTNLRNYLEEIASQNKQILAELKRGNELLEQGKAKAETASKTKGATSEFIEGSDKPPVTVETVKEAPLKTVETVEVQESKPAVPRRQDAPVEGLAAMGTMTAPKPAAKKSK